MSEFAAALIGALIGGAATFWATWWQTKRVLLHERQLAREAFDEQRRGMRREVDQQAARELLPWLPGLERVLPDIAQGFHLYQSSGAGANARISEMRDLQHSTVALLSSQGARDAWAQLRTLVSELATAWSSTDSGDLAFNEGWTEQHLSRSKADVESYIVYVRAHLLAIIDDSADPPPIEAPPVLRRQDMSVWQPPKPRV